MYPMINKKQTGHRLRYLMELKDMEPKDIQEYLSLACVQTVYRWLEGINVPSVDHLYALSVLFGVPVDSLLAGNRDFGKNPQDYSMLRRVNMYGQRILEEKAA